MKITNFLSILLVSSMLCSFQTATSQNVKKQKKNIGIQLYSVRDDISKDFQSTVKAVGAAGYKYIEAASYNDGKLYNMNPVEFKKAIEGAGMTVLSTHVGKSLPSMNPDSINWNEIWTWWDVCIDAHKAAGAKYIVTPSMPTPQTLKELGVYCDYYNKIGEKCQAKGLKFGYHNHDFEFKEIEGKVMYDYMIENTDPAKVFFEMDVYWVVRGGKSPVEYFKKYPGRFDLLHIKDYKELGQSGMVGFDAIFNNIKAAGTKYLIVEVEHYDYTPIESIQKSFDYLLNAPFVKADYSSVTKKQKTLTQ